jgi:hypothetical protein
VTPESQRLIVRRTSASPPSGKSDLSKKVSFYLRGPFDSANIFLSCIPSFMSDLNPEALHPWVPDSRIVPWRTLPRDTPCSFSRPIDRTLDRAFHRPSDVLLQLLLPWYSERLGGNPFLPTISTCLICTYYRSIAHNVPDLVYRSSHHQ